MAIALSLSPLAAYGQTSASPATNATTSSQTTVADDRGDRREHHNYGWIGLLGLLGLTGLMRKRHEVVKSTTRIGRTLVGRWRARITNNRSLRGRLFDYESIGLAWQK